MTETPQHPTEPPADEPVTDPVAETLPAAPEPAPAPATETPPAPVAETLPAPETEPVAETLPAAPEHPSVDEQLARVEMFGSGGLDWHAVSPSLATTRTITLVLWLVPLIIAAGVGAVLLTSWLWAAVAALVLVLIWGLWLIRRQVSAMSYLELAEDLVIRKGRLFRQVTSVPYGRLQYVDVQSGPLERKYGMATLQIFTASPSTSATLPGLLIATAEEMRERLMARGEAQRAGL